MSKPIPYMQFYIADYMGDTTHLTTEQHGAYDLILFSYWQRQKPLEEFMLPMISKLGEERWAEHRDIIAGFFQVADGKWKHKRIELELKKVRDQAKKNRAAGIKSGESRRAKKTQNERAFNERSTNVQRNPNETRSSHTKGNDADAVPIEKARLTRTENELLDARDKVFSLEAQIKQMAGAS